MAFVDVLKDCGGVGGCVSWQVLGWYAAAAAVEKEEESFAATGGF